MTSHHTPSRSTIGRDFMNFGNEAIAVHRATELHDARRLGSAPRSTTQLAFAIRHRLGGLMISCGSWLAGATTPTIVPIPERTLTPGR